MSLDSRALRSFLAVADQLHFGRAADRMNIAQSVLSADIKRLEDSIGAPLLTRGRRAAVRLTRTGATFLDEARRAIEQIDRAERIGRSAAFGEAGPLRLGYIFSAAITGLLAASFRALREQAPLLDIRASQMETPEQIASVADGRLDIAFIRPRPTYPPELSVDIVHREPLLIAMADSHPLLARRDIRVGDLAREPFIVPQFGDQGGLMVHIERLAQAGGFEPSAILPTGDFVTGASLAAAGYGVILVPSSLAALRTRGLVLREFSDYRDEIELALARRKADFTRVAAILMTAAAELATSG